MLFFLNQHSDTSLVEIATKLLKSPSPHPDCAFTLLRAVWGKDFSVIKRIQHAKLFINTGYILHAKAVLSYIEEESFEEIRLDDRLAISLPEVFVLLPETTDLIKIFDLLFEKYNADEARLIELKLKTVYNLIVSGRQNVAKRLFQSISFGRIDNPVPQVLFIIICEHFSMFKHALGIINRVASKATCHPNMQVHMAINKMHLDEIVCAKRILYNHIKAYPDSYPGFFWYGKIHNCSGRHTEALKWINRSLDLIDRGVFSNKYLSGTSRCLSLLEKGNIYRALKAPKMAIQYYTEAIEVKHAEEFRLWFACFECAMAFVDLGELDMAKRIVYKGQMFNSSILNKNYNPCTILSWFLTGQLQKQTDLFLNKRADEYLYNWPWSFQAPYNNWILLLIGSVMEKKYQLSKAKEIYRKINQSGPNFRGGREKQGEDSQAMEFKNGIFTNHVLRNLQQGSWSFDPNWHTLEILINSAS